jgi:hypothetical protein
MAVEYERLSAIDLPDNFTTPYPKTFMKIVIILT